MGFRFRKSFKIIPGVRLNIGKKGLSTTVGGRGLSVNIGKKGAYLNAGIPGTGISYREKIGVNVNNKNRQIYGSNQHSVGYETSRVVKLLVYTILALFCLSLMLTIGSLFFRTPTVSVEEDRPRLVTPPDPVAPIPNISFDLKPVIADNTKNTVLIEGTLK